MGNLFTYNFDTFKFNILNVVECDIRDTFITLVSFNSELGMGTLKIDRFEMTDIPKEVVMHILQNAKYWKTVSNKHLTMES